MIADVNLFSRPLIMLIILIIIIIHNLFGLRLTLPLIATTDLAHFINVACIIWSKITFGARDVNSRDRDIGLRRPRRCHFFVETRLRRDLGASRDHLENETSRPRPHP